MKNTFAAAFLWNKYVILSEAKNLKTYGEEQKILRFAQNDKGLYIAAATGAMYGVPTMLQST